MTAHGVPAPGAIGMLCGSALDLEGDSVSLAQRLTGTTTAQPLRLIELPYFKGADPHDPLVSPGNSNAVLAPEGIRTPDPLEAR